MTDPSNFGMYISGVKPLPFQSILLQKWNWLCIENFNMPYIIKEDNCLYAIRILILYWKILLSYLNIDWKCLRCLMIFIKDRKSTILSKRSVINCYYFQWSLYTKVHVQCMLSLNYVLACEWWCLGNNEKFVGICGSKENTTIFLEFSLFYLDDFTKMNQSWDNYFCFGVAAQPNCTLVQYDNLSIW